MKVSGQEVKVRMTDDRPVMVHSTTKHLRCTVAKVIGNTQSKHALPPLIIKLVGSDRKTTVVETVGGARVSCSTLMNVGDQILISIDDLKYQGRAQ